MGHASGETADGLHLLRLAELFLELVLAGDVAPDHDEIGEAAFLVLHRGNAHQLHERHAVRSPADDLAGPAAIANDAVEHVGVEGLGLRLVLQVSVVVAKGGVAGPARRALEGRVHVDDGAGRVGDHDRVG